MSGKQRGTRLGTIGEELLAAIVFSLTLKGKEEAMGHGGAEHQGVRMQETLGLETAHAKAERAWRGRLKEFITARASMRSGGSRARSARVQLIRPPVLL